MNADVPPDIALAQVSAAPTRFQGQWCISWRVTNNAAEKLLISSARLPHGQFKSEEINFQPAVELHAGEKFLFEANVHCDEPVGLVTENAFVILYVEWREQAWRIYVRIRVTIDSNGEPQTATELITTQKVGFSGITQ